MKGGDIYERKKENVPSRKQKEFPSWSENAQAQSYPQRLQDRNAVLTIFPGSRLHLARRLGGLFLLRLK